MVIELKIFFETHIMVLGQRTLKSTPSIPGPLFQSYFLTIGEEFVGYGSELIVLSDSLHYSTSCTELLIKSFTDTE